MASIFTRIMKGELPGHFVYEDDLCVAMMTIQPFTTGHLLVIPREEIDHWDDMPPALAAHMMQICQKMAKALKSAYPSKRVGVMIMGLDVAHVHIHVFPANSVEDFDASHPKPTVSSDVLEEVATKIKKVL